MWLTKTVEYVLPADFKSFGLIPRTLEGLGGIITSPFIHGDFNHLISNSLPFFLLSVAIFYFYRRNAFRIISFTWIITNVAVWIGGRYTTHIGASGLVYAFASFMFFSGILSKERHLIAISLLVSFLYGGMIWGIFPADPNISWESHLFGFFSGFIVAFYMGKQQIINQTGIHENNDNEFTEISNTHDKDYDIFYHFNDDNE
jgi:membrane associated rhomboid family serine protease